MVLLGERLTIWQWLGAGCILLTALLAAYSSEDADQSEE
jgi:drug/metabolite transporter (DMT)-like permease